MSFLMSGESAPFSPAEPCTVTDGPHYGDEDQRRFLVADATTRDGAASARIVIWRCRFCKVLLVGIGRTDVSLDRESGNFDAYGQEFTWLQESSG
jgi:hypothetical protein